MDELLKKKDTVVIEAEVKKEVEYKRVGSLRLKKGLSVFTYNPMTGEVKKLVVEKKVSIGIDKKAKKEIKATHDSNVIYIQALNMKNAEKKAYKMLKQVEAENERRKNSGK